MSGKVKTREVYGKLWPEDWTQVQIELECYLFDHSAEAGGLGAHQHMKNAMQLLWPETYYGDVKPGVSKWRPEIDKMVWAWCNYSKIIVLGHASAAKTHTFARIAACAYMADPFDTITTLTSTHLSGLRKRIWSDLKNSLETNAVGANFYIRNHDMTARPDVVPKEDKYIFEGIATDKGDDAVSKIQGNHSRNHRHIIIDEADGTPSAIFDASANLMTDKDFKMVCLANPAKRFNELGAWAEPVQGWQNLDPDVDFDWMSKKGAFVMRLDGLKSPNIVHQESLFPWLIDQKYVDNVIQSHGLNSPRYWTYVRAWYPPDGALGTVMSPAILDRGNHVHDFKFEPTPIAAFDPAFEGGDSAMITFGEYGPVGKAPYRLNVTEQHSIKCVVTKGSDPLDYLIAREVMKQCKERKVEPQNFVMDITGNARGVYAILQKEWSMKIVGVNFGGSATLRPVRFGDPTPAKDLYDRFVTELWFATREFIMDGGVGGLEGMEKLKDELQAREYEMQSERKTKIETKRDFKERLGYSPDRADSFVLMIELLRQFGAVAGKPEDFKGGSRDERALERAVAYSKIERFDTVDI